MSDSLRDQLLGLILCTCLRNDSRDRLRVAWPDMHPVIAKIESKAIVIVSLRLPVFRGDLAYRRGQSSRIHLHSLFDNLILRKSSHELTKRRIIERHRF